MSAKVLSVRVDDDVREQLEGKAQQLRTPFPQLIRWILEDAAQKPAVDLLPVPMPEVVSDD